MHSNNLQRKTCKQLTRADIILSKYKNNCKTKQAIPILPLVIEFIRFRNFKVKQKFPFSAEQNINVYIMLN